MSMRISINDNVNNSIVVDTINMLRNACVNAESVEDLVKIFKYAYHMKNTDQDFKDYTLTDLYNIARKQIKARFEEDMDRFLKLLDETIPMTCPRKGAFKAYKLGRCTASWIDLETGLKRNPSYAIIELYIPEDAKRSSAFGKKCRCDKARVDKITQFGNLEDKHLSIAYANFDGKFKYRLNGWVKPTHAFNDNRFNECTSGIHFFMTVNDVLEYFTGLI